MRGLIRILGSVPDPRTGNAQRHELLDLLTIALVASTVHDSGAWDAGTATVDALVVGGAL